MYTYAKLLGFAGRRIAYEVSMTGPKMDPFWGSFRDPFGLRFGFHFVSILGSILRYLVCVSGPGPFNFAILGSILRNSVCVSRQGLFNFAILVSILGNCVCVCKMRKTLKLQSNIFHHVLVLTNRLNSGRKNR